jgi:hypothetical protein
VVEPGHAGALNLREEVARRLREEGGVERAQGFYGESMNRYRRALIFVPDDLESLRALGELHELEATPVAEPASELRAVPTTPVLREPTTFFVTLIEEPPADASPEFEVTRINASGKEIVTARPDGDRLHWVASHTFRRTGLHRVVFTAGEIALANELDVAPRQGTGAQARRDDPPTTVQHAVPPGVNTGMTTVSTDDGIDWSLPEERRITPMVVQEPEPAPTMAPPDPPNMSTTPPAPWTSGAL